MEVLYVYFSDKNSKNNNPLLKKNNSKKTYSGTKQGTNR